MFYNTHTKVVQQDYQGDFTVPLKDEKPDKDRELYVVVQSGIDTEKYEVQYTVITKTLMVVRDILLDRVKQKRKQAEQGGVVIPGTDIRLDTSRVDTQMLHNALIGLKTFKPDAVINYRTDSGWVNLTVDALEQLFNLVSNHVEACFTREKQISESIEQASTADEAIEIFSSEIDNGWPVYA